VRCAVVGDPVWASSTRKLFPKTLPFELRQFGSDDEASAWQWLGARLE
jgi:hypothetical protein